jgi:hypothetical protein
MADNQVQIQPATAAQWALDFLQRANMTGADVERFGVARAMLQAIAAGSVLVTPSSAMLEQADAERLKAAGTNGAANGAAADSPP